MCCSLGFGQLSSSTITKLVIIKYYSSENRLFNKKSELVADSRVAVFAIFCVWARLPLWQNLKTTIDMRQNTNEILAENARRCAILRNASRPPRPLTAATVAANAPVGIAMAC